MVNNGLTAGFAGRVQHNENLAVYFDFRTGD